MKVKRGLLFWLSAAWLVVVVGAAAFADVLAPDPDRLYTDVAGRPPSWRHPFGTSRIGHDLLARSMHGSRLVLVVMGASTLVGLALGGALGMLAGYARGWIERVVLVVLDAWIAIPSFMALLAVVTYVGRQVWIIALAIGLVTVPMFARVVRTATGVVAGSDYVAAARVLGARHARVLWRDVAPNVVGPVAAYTFVAMGMALLMEGTLTYLGFGLNFRDVTWGSLVQEGQRELDVRPYLALIPAGLFFATILALNVVGDRWSARYVATRWRRTTPPVTTPSAVVASSDDLLLLDGVTTTIATATGTVHAVRDVTLALPRGMVVALVGESGSGKTMLARSILRLLPAGGATAGHVWLDGDDLLALDARALREVRGRRIATVLQDPMTSLDPVVRVGAQIAELVRVHLGVGRRAARARARELLADVGVGDAPRRARQYPHELSGGLRQRVAIAMALACEPALLIADEPTSALDVTVQAQILDLLLRLQQERHLTVLLVTHDMGIVARYADEVAVMYAGRIVERGSTAALFAQPSMPYTAALLAAVPRVDGDSHARITGIVGQPADARDVPAGCSFAPRCAYADERCVGERPELTGLLGHEVACFHPLSGL